MSFGVKFTSLSRKPDVSNISTWGADWATSNWLWPCKIISVSYPSNGYETVTLTD